MKRLWLLIMLIMTNATFAQVSIILKKIPANTPTNPTLYLASSLNNWNPKDSNYSFKMNADGYYEITLPNQPKEIEFKITQGSWDHSEANADGTPAANHKADLNATKSVEIVIPRWTIPQQKKHTISGDVRILSNNFKVPQLNTTRRIWIYLPPNYHKTKKRYPVIYMQDGQNLFDDATSFSGEWGVDETLNRFGEKGELSAIVVGIDNGGSERLDEYSPWENDKYKKGGKGSLYLEFLVKTLKPFIDKSFRTYRGPKNTAVIGSSMGGLISFYAGIKYPQIFGKVGVFSPSFWFSDKNLMAYMNRNHKNLKHSKFYFVAGANEGDDMPGHIREVEKKLLQFIPAKDIHVKIDQDGTHSEGYWRREFGNAVLWLFNEIDETY